MSLEIMTAMERRCQRAHHRPVRDHVAGQPFLHTKCAYDWKWTASATGGTSANQKAGEIRAGASNYDLYM